MGEPRLAVVIPAFCEAATIGPVVVAAKRFAEVLVVDDCSSDETGKRAEEAGATVVRNPENRGYDGTLSRGFEEAFARGYSHVVTMDADGEHDPATLASFRNCLIGEGYPLVLGYRPRKQRVAELVMGWYFRARFGVRDILCGMKGYDLALWQQNGGFDHTESIGTELATMALRRGIKFTQVPVSGTRRADAPRFDRRLRANMRILSALLRSMRREPLSH